MSRYDTECAFRKEKEVGLTVPLWTAVLGILFAHCMPAVGGGERVALGVSGRTICMLHVISQVRALSDCSHISTHRRKVKLTDGELLLLGVYFIRSDFVYFSFVSPV